MKIVLLTIVLQAFVVPFVACVATFDLSVDTVLQRTAYAYGIWIVLVPAAAGLFLHDIKLALLAWLLQLACSYLPVLCLQRVSMTDIEQFTVVQLSLLGGIVAGYYSWWWLGAAIAIVVSWLGVRVLDHFTEHKRYSRQFDRYVRTCYCRFSQRYKTAIDRTKLKPAQRQALLSLMIVENANNPRLYRWLERVSYRLKPRPITSGIMQVYAKTLLSDEVSIRLSARIIRSVYKQHRRKSEDAIMMQLGLIYNGEEEYGATIIAVLEALS
jgi:hypothetical protein